MNRTEKITKIKELEKLIKEKKEQINEEAKKLEILESQLKQVNISEIPVLLFLINETLPLPEKNEDFEYEYVYYCPDLDDVKIIIKNSDDEFLPNTVDMREFFKEIDIPKRIWPGRIENYSEKLDYSVSQLKAIINALFASNSINNWTELASLLKTLTNVETKSKNGNGQSKVLKPTN